MRERVLLLGDPTARPPGLERGLVRAGFSLVESTGTKSTTPPDLALLAVPDAGSTLERAMAGVHALPWTGVPVIVLLATADHGGIIRALSLGAADAVTAPVDLAELCARLEARLRSRAEMQRAAGAGSLTAELFLAIEDVASAQGPDEMLERLVRRVGAGLAVDHCACLIPSADGRYARLVAVHENPAVPDLNVDLFHYPEAIEAAVSGRTVHAPEVLRDRVFLAHLAQWPDSPEVREIESAAAIPLITRRSVRAVIVMRTRRGDPPLTVEQVRLVEQLVNATVALLEREDRRSEDLRRHRLAAITDPLTGCATVEALDRRLREEFERARRYGSGLALALLHIDALRELNLLLAAGAGDQFLAELGAFLLSEVRSPDFVARYGSDEFALLMPATAFGGARKLVDRIEARLAAHSWTQVPLPTRPRLLVGLVALPHPSIARVEDLLAEAENALRSGNIGRTAA